jgi:vacuolar-type H+-ATPase subunit E/Vma4
METKISDAQIEVWEAKEKLYEALKNIPEGKKLEFLNHMAQNTIEKYFKGKVVIFTKV